MKPGNDFVLIKYKKYNVNIFKISKSTTIIIRIRRMFSKHLGKCFFNFIIKVRDNPDK